MKRRPLWARSLRQRLLIVVLCVAIAPLVFVWGGNLGDATVGEQMRQVVLLATNQSARAVEQDSAEADLVERLDKLSWTYAVRIRVLDADGTVAHDLDQEHDHSIAYRVGSLFFGGGDEAPSLARWDAEQPALAERPLVAEIRDTGRGSGCQSVENRTLLVCEAGLALPSGEVVFVQQSSRRAIRSLYDARYPLLKLTLFVGIVALLMGWWHGWTWVLPIERLRDQALMRVEHPLSAPPLGLERDDEIGDLAGAFDQLLAAVRDKAQANERFVANLAHEMKNPVAAVRAASEALASGRPVDDKRAERLARVLDDSSKRLDELVTGLLELARVEAGHETSPRAPVDMGELVAGLVASVSRDERFAQVVFVADETTKAAVVADVGQVETAVRNLLVNAASFAGDGGRVVARVRSADDTVIIEVSDDGPGIATDALPRVFERFFTTRGEREGTGLGLALVAAVARAHGGRATAESELGAGATFRIELPQG